MHITIPKGRLEIDEAAFTEFFLETALRNGFDSLKKRDLDVLLFHCLSKYGDLAQKSNNELSLLLQVPETKVASLTREARLRFGNINDEWVRDQTIALLARSKLEVRKEQIKLPVEDPLLKDCINAKLKSIGRFGDSSFNSEILSIDVHSFGELLESMLGDDAARVQDQILQDDAIEEVPAWRELFDIACRSFADGAGRRAGEKLVDLGTFFATGGADSIVSLGNGLRRLLRTVYTQQNQDGGEE